MSQPSLAYACAVCNKKCRPLRCSRCRTVVYCSVQCQRAHWKAEHRDKCGSASAAPQDAWDELKQTIIQLAPEEAHQQYQMVQDEIKRLERLEHVKPKSRSACRQRSDDETDVDSSSTPTESEDISPPAKEKALANTEVNTKSSKNEKAFSLLGSRRDRDWIYVVEEMASISCYQVTLRPHNQTEELPDLNDLSVSIHVDSHGSTVVVLNLLDKTIVCARFPGRVATTTETKDSVQVQRQSDCLSLRIECQDTIGDDCLGNSATSSLAAVCAIRCRYCSQSLVTHANRIGQVLPLPSGYWDEITDYLICYNGQPAVDFSASSTSAQEDLALQDSSVVVLHRSNLEGSVCVLAVEGYGEEQDGPEDTPRQADSATFRGPRTWGDMVGGATLCCSSCCTTLGFASLAFPETFRLLKHRLSSEADEQWKSLYTCSSFVAHEMVRYAESKAIFTFVVSVRSEERPAHSSPVCLLLRLLSWDTRQARSIESASCDDGEQADVLNFRKVLKVIYEVAEDRTVNASQHKSSDPRNWTWGGVDLCCAPDLSEGGKHPLDMTTDSSQVDMTTDTSQQRNVSSVRMCLSADEWGELRQDLEEISKSYSKAVRDAAILVKLGTEPVKWGDATIGISILPLLS